MLNPRLSFYKWKNWMVAIFRVYNFKKFLFLISFFVFSFIFFCKKKSPKSCSPFIISFFQPSLLNTFPFLHLLLLLLLLSFNTRVSTSSEWKILLQHGFVWHFFFRFGSKVRAVRFAALVFFAKGERLTQCGTCAFCIWSVYLPSLVLSVIRSFVRSFVPCSML